MVPCFKVSACESTSAGCRRPAMMELIAQPHDEPRLVRRIEVDLALRREIRLARVGAREVGLLRGARVGSVAVAAELPEDRLPDQRLELGRVRREQLACADRLR